MTIYSLDILFSWFGTSLFVVPCPVLTCFLTRIQISQEAGQVVWYSYLFHNFPQFIVIHEVKGFDIDNKAEIDVFLELSCFSMIQRMLAVWSLVPLPFLKPVWTSGSSQFTYCWSLSSVQSLSHVQLFATPWIAARQASLSITISCSSLRLTSIESVMPSSHLILSSPSPPAPNPSQHQSLFQWVSSSHEVAKVLELQLYHHSFQRNPRADLRQNGLVGSPCSPRNSQESSPTPQFKSINSSVLSLLHSPTLTPIHDHRKNHSLD